MDTERTEAATILQWRLSLRHARYVETIRAAGLEHVDDFPRREYRRRLLQLARPGSRKGRPIEDFDREQFRTDLAAAWLRLSSDGYEITRPAMAERLYLSESTLARRLRVLKLKWAKVKTGTW